MQTSIDKLACLDSYQNILLYFDKYSTRDVFIHSNVSIDILLKFILKFGLKFKICTKNPNHDTKLCSACSIFFYKFFENFGSFNCEFLLYYFIFINFQNKYLLNSMLEGFIYKDTLIKFINDHKGTKCLKQFSTGKSLKLTNNNLIIYLALYLISWNNYYYFKTKENNTDFAILITNTINIPIQKYINKYSETAQINMYKFRYLTLKFFNFSFSSDISDDSYSKFNNNQKMVVKYNDKFIAKYNLTDNRFEYTFDIFDNNIKSLFTSIELETFIFKKHKCFCKKDHIVGYCQNYILIFNSFEKKLKSCNFKIILDLDTRCKCALYNKITVYNEEIDIFCAKFNNFKNNINLFYHYYLKSNEYIFDKKFNPFDKIDPYYISETFNSQTLCKIYEYRIQLIYEALLLRFRTYLFEKPFYTLEFMHILIRTRSYPILEKFNDKYLKNLFMLYKFGSIKNRLYHKSQVFTELFTNITDLNIEVFNTNEHNAVLYKTLNDIKIINKDSIYVINDIKFTLINNINILEHIPNCTHVKMKVSSINLDSNWSKHIKLDPTAIELNYSIEINTINTTVKYIMPKYRFKIFYSNKQKRHEKSLYKAKSVKYLKHKLYLDYILNRLYYKKYQS
jgi:hypothetical protein